MDVDVAIRTRRTHKVFGPEPVERETLLELLDLARWAPNHHLTNPWRFRVVGSQARAALRGAAGEEAGGKLDRAPTLVVVSVVGDDEEDLLAAGCAAYIVLLAAHARGLVAYWRTPGVLREPEGRAAVGLAGAERFVALLYLGPARQAAREPERAPVEAVVSFLP